MIPEFLSQRLTRRQFTLGSTVSAVALTFMPARTIFAAARETDALSSLGYPELKVTITDTGFTGVPASTAAGRYLITATDQTSNHQGTLAFLSPTSAGVSAADFLQLVGGAGGATPMAGATPASGASNEEVPLIVYEMYFAGGTGSPPEGVIDLKPGEYVIWSDDPTGPQKPAIMQVTGDFPVDVKDPQSDLTATLVDFAISFEGMPTAGKHTLEVQNHGAQPHFLLVFKGPDSLTKEQAVAALTTPEGATPAPGTPSQNDFQPVFYSPTQSIGTVTWHPIELTAGTYLAACFFPTAGTGVPHAMNGMIDVFKVTG
jgi:hypothetical protein